MRIGEISFCDKVGYNIRSDETKKMILDEVEKKYGLKIIAKHFEKYNERSLNVLNQNPHMVCVRSNGNPYFLYLTRYNHTDLCIFIDKKIQQGYFLPRMIVTHMMFGKNKAIHDDTIIDGEMVKTKDGKWMYLMNDLLVYQGQYLKDTNLVRRLNMLYACLETEYHEDDMNPFTVAVKRFFTYDELPCLEDHANSLNYTCRGVYFKPLFLKFKDILINFDDSLVKKVKREKVGGTFMLQRDIEQEAVQETPTKHEPKPVVDTHSKQTTLYDVSSQSQSQTRSFATRKTSSPDVYEMLDTDGTIVGTACVPTLALSKKMRVLFEDKNLVDKIDLKYVFNERFNKWSPML